MTIEGGAEGAEDGALEAPISSQDDSKWEAEARELGWVPEEEFKGERRPTKFKTAREFVEDIPPYVKKLLERQEKKLTERLQGIEKVNSKTVAEITRIHQQEIADLKAQRTEAIKAGDVKLVDHLDGQIDKRKEDAPLTDDPQAKKAEAEKAFAEAHPWYGSNRKMTAFARGLSNDLNVENPDLSYEDNIKAVLVAVREEFPEYFEKKSSANGHADVDGGSDNGSGPSRSDPFAKLSSAERQKATADMKAYPKIYPTKESWVKAYNS